MSSSWKAALAAILLCSALLVGCGDYYRPTAVPIIKPGGDPSGFEAAIVLTTNPSGRQGALMNVDLSGDTNVGNHFVGRGPVRAALLPGTTSSTYVANAQDSTVTVAGYGATGTVNSITLLQGSVPTSVGSTRSGTMYVTMTGANSYSDANCPGSGLLGVIRGALLESHVCVGHNPVYVIGSPDQNRAYVLNKDDDTVSVVDATSRTVITTIALPAGSGPIKGVAHPTRGVLYVLNSNGTVSTIITSDLTIASTDSTGGTSPVDIFYDNHFSRLFVLNHGNSSLRAFDVPVNLPENPRDVTVGAVPTSLVVLPDGSRAYVANSAEDSVSVINLSTFAEKKIDLADTAASPAPHTPVSISATRDSSRVVVANSGSKDVSIIRTNTDSEVKDAQGLPARLPAPYQDSRCTPTTSTPCARQTPAQVLTLVKQ
jgi:YVTN family beta-propeller protein